jgi:nucleoid-associated protein
VSIDNIIVHRLEKERKSASTLHPRHEELAVSTAAENLLRNLLSTYEEKTGKAFGVFQDDHKVNLFSGYLKRFLDGEIGFTDFTLQSMARFKQVIDKAEWATGGYVAFIVYHTKSGTNIKRYLLVVMLNDRSGTAVDPKTLEIRDVTHLMLD